MCIKTHTYILNFCLCLMLIACRIKVCECATDQYLDTCPAWYVWLYIAYASGQYIWIILNGSTCFTARKLHLLCKAECCHFVWVGCWSGSASGLVSCSECHGARNAVCTLVLHHKLFGSHAILHQSNATSQELPFHRVQTQKRALNRLDLQNSPQRATVSLIIKKP